MLYQIKSYIKFLLKSTNQHGVHSPFVYDLVTKCFYDKTKFDDYVKIENYRTSLLKNKRTIKVTDLGAGSKITKSNKRVISKIAQNVSTSKHRAKLLYRLSHYFKFNTVLELGTSLGISTNAISLGNSKGKITTIEGCPNISTFAENNFKQLNLENIEVINEDFSEFLKKLNSNTYDFVFFDGNHQKEATLEYFETLLPTAHNNTLFIFDDIYWSKGMTEAWNEIKQHPRVTVSIDTFFWGLVFFRIEQQKEHFTIRV